MISLLKCKLWSCMTIISLSKKFQTSGTMHWFITFHLDQRVVHAVSTKFMLNLLTNGGAKATLYLELLEVILDCACDEPDFLINVTVMGLQSETKIQSQWRRSDYLLIWWILTKRQILGEKLNLQVVLNGTDSTNSWTKWKLQEHMCVLAFCKKFKGIGICYKGICYYL